MGPVCEENIKQLKLYNLTSKVKAVSVYKSLSLNERDLEIVAVEMSPNSSYCLRKILLSLQFHYCNK